MSLTVEEIRRAMRLRRSNLGIRARLTAARRLAKYAASDALPQGQRIALYLATGGELDCRFLLNALWRQGKSCYLPVLSHPDSAKQRNYWMGFRSYKPGQLLVKNRYGILEPETGGLCPATQLDWVAVPLVACDNQGRRIGMGGGYYDRCFAFKKRAGSNKLKQRTPVLVGVAYAFQRHSGLPSQPWDVDLDCCWLI